MLVRPDERVPLARLLQFLEHGEHLAHDCARAQAALAPDAGARRFLAGQARQEALHAAVFHGAVAWLAPRHLGECPVLPPLERYRALIEEAIEGRRFAETLLAEQIILEGLGEAILKRLEAGLVKRNAGFGRLRRILLHQEEAHHAFGRRALDRAIEAGQASPEVLRERAPEYLAVADAMVLALGDLFASIDENATAYIGDARSALPSWLVQ
jgi:hypothetical protein